MTTREGMATADNDRFLRYWHEISTTFSLNFATNQINGTHTIKEGAIGNGMEIETMS